MLRVEPRLASRLGVRVREARLHPYSATKPPRFATLEGLANAGGACKHLQTGVARGLRYESYLVGARTVAGDCYVSTMPETRIVLAYLNGAFLVGEQR